MSPSTSPIDETARRAEKVRQVMDACIARRAAGQAVTDQSLCEAYPDLMPELGEALRNLKLVQQARKAVEQGVATGLHIRCPHCRNPIEVLDDSSLSEVVCPSCGSQFSLTDDTDRTFQANQLEMVNHFQLLDRVGVGAFGSVWSARDTQLDRMVALKIPRKGQLSGEETEQFIREARAAAQLKHPNIVNVLEVGRYKDRVYIACDFIQGLDLADWLTDQHASPLEAAELCETLADALQHAHDHGVVHRDMKPSNIMLDTEGEPHLMDFGLAKRDGGEMTMTVEGKILGTPAYMSPEQARGAAHDADARSDVYSLGVILFEVLTGERPFRGNTRMLLHQVLLEDAPSPRKLNQSVPRDLETICLKCLEKDPDRRYQSAGELRDDLKNFRLGKPVHARPISKITRAWRWCKRHPMAATTLALLLISFVAITVAWQHAEVASEQLRQNLYQAEILSAYEAFGSGDLSRASDLLIKQLPDGGRNDLRGFEWYYLADLCSENEADAHTLEKMIVSAAVDTKNKFVFALLRNEELLRNDEIIQFDLVSRRRKTVYQSSNVQTFHPRCVAVSTNGAMLAIGGGSSDENSGKIEVRRLDIEGLIEVFTDAVVRKLAFAPDGIHVASVDATGVVYLWNAATGDLQWRQKFVDHAGGHAALEFSPDGRTLVTLHNRVAAFWDASTGDRQEFIEDLGSWLLDVVFSPDGSRIVIVGERLHIVDASTLELYPPVYNKYLEFAAAAAFSRNGKQLAVATMAKKILILDAETTDVIDVLPENRLYGDAAQFLIYSLDGDKLYSVSHDSIRTLQLDQGSKSQEVGMRWGQWFAVDQSSSSVAFPGPVRGNDVLMWDLTKPEPYRLSGHDMAVRSTAFSADGKLLVTGDNNGSIRVWDTNSRTHVAEFSLTDESGETVGVHVLACSPVKDLLVAGDYGSTICGWEIKTGRQLWSKSGHKAEDILFAPDGRMFSAGGDGQWFDPGYLTVWNVDGKPRQVQRIAHDRFVSNLGWWQSEDGKQMLLVAADRACEIVLYDARGQLVRQRIFRGHTTFRAYNLLFDPSGRTLISTGYDNTVRMWSVTTGRQIGILNRREFSLGAFVQSTRQGQHLLAEFHARTLIGNSIDTPSLDAVWQRRGRQ